MATRRRVSQQRVAGLLLRDRNRAELPGQLPGHSDGTLFHQPGESWLGSEVRLHLVRLEFRGCRVRVPVPPGNKRSHARGDTRDVREQGPRAQVPDVRMHRRRELCGCGEEAEAASGARAGTEERQAGFLEGKLGRKVRLATGDYNSRVTTWRQVI